MEIIPLNNNGYITKIIENLYLGDIECSQNKLIIDSNNITSIINLSNSNNYSNNYIKFDNIDYYDINIDDNRSVNISQYFDKCINIIDNSRNQNKNILVHCMNGVSRSVTIILAYLIKNGHKLNEALIYLKNIRTNQYVRPNIGFFKQLIEFEINQSLT